jgi:hypothetical protein
MKFLLQFYLIIYFIKKIISLENITEKCQEFCSMEGGECQNLKCKCKEGYSTLFTEEKILLCNYKRYNKISVGLVEFFFGFGIGHIYCKRYLNGFIQLFGELISFCLMGCLFWYFLLYDNHFNISFTLTNSFLKLYCPFAIVFVLSWQVIDTVLFFMGFYLDGNGIELF